MEPIVPQPGNDRDPRHFVGRAITTDRARTRLAAGANLLLTDPRRMGKTFWMHTFAAREKGFQCYFIDYEGVGTVEDFLTRTAQALSESPSLPKQARRVLAMIFDNVESVGLPGLIAVKTYHRQTSAHRLLNDTLKSLDQGESSIPLVMMDEVPMAIDNIAQREGAEEASELLQTLRALRQGTVNVRWIVSGSVGFHHVLRSAHTTSGGLNDLEPLPLGPLPDDEARELASRLLLGIRQMPTENVVSALVEVSGGVPFILHKVASTLEQRQHRVTTSEDVHDCFENFIDDPDEFGWFEHFLTRMEPYYGKRSRLANDVLDAAVSTARNWVPMNDLPQKPGADKVVEYLIKDHYLERRGRTVRWRYPALQYIWARRRGIWNRP